MASLSLCCSSRPSAQSIALGFHNPNWRADSSSRNLLHFQPNLHSTPSTFRFKNAARLLIKRKLPLLHASNQPSEGPIKKSEGNTSGNESTAQGPPFLTILAGFVVFAVVVWIIVSIVSWLFGLLRVIFFK